MALDLSVTGNGGSGEKYTYTCDAALIKKYAQTVIANYDLFATKSIALTFNTMGLSNLEVGAGYSATPTLSSVSTRVAKTGNTKTYYKA